ncbi:Prefoldin subunit 6 [Recurvomyces mirabilis]|nr:Prefoldin subunit 6 [Recurvomyces mirabilis]
MEQQKQLQALSDQYQGLQNELTTLVQARQKLEGQFTENESVQKVWKHRKHTKVHFADSMQEFAGLDDDAKIYKLVGPVLLRQETTEAKSTVDGRLEYIGKEIKRIEESITEIQSKSEGKRSEVGLPSYYFCPTITSLIISQIMQIQAQAQQSAGQA